MGLWGKGVLAIWHDVDSAAIEDFYAWHVLEHMPERVGLPSFLRGRRYVVHEGRPRFFNFYETRRLEDLSSPVYRERLNAPTPWTRQVVPHFRDMSRTVCAVTASLGRGEGGFLETITFRKTAASDQALAALTEDLLPRLLAVPGIVGVHLLHGKMAASRSDSAEKKLRNQPDGMVDGTLLIEAVGADRLLTLREGVGATKALMERGASADLKRAIYRFEYGLSHQELEPEASGVV